MAIIKVEELSRNVRISFVRRLHLAATLVIVAVVVAAPALAREDKGFTAALRAGYGLPVGSVDAGEPGNAPAISLSAVYAGSIPLWLGAGYRHRNFFVGGYFQYGVGLINSGDNFISDCNTSGVKCSGYVMRLGIEWTYNFMPDATFMPWAGVGAGYEIAHLSRSSGGRYPAGISYKGIEALIEVGGDYRLSTSFSVGPFGALSLGQYLWDSFGDIPNKATHEWIWLGVKGTFNL